MLKIKHAKNIFGTENSKIALDGLTRFSDNLDVILISMGISDMILWFFLAYSYCTMDNPLLIRPICLLLFQRAQPPRRLAPVPLSAR